MIKWNDSKILENISNISNPILVLKDNAYNVGLEKVLNLVKDKVYMYAVNTIDEAKKIYDIVPDSYIILLGHEKIVDKRYIYSVSDMSDFIFCLNNKLSFHYELNISMNRFGFNEINHSIINNKLCEGIYFHSNGNDIKADINKFKNMIKHIKRRDLLYHIGGSSYKNINHNYFNRVGIDIYKDSYEMYANIIKIRNVKKSESIGYNNYKIKEDSIIAILDVGYKNGLLKNETYKVIINNNEYNSISMCMDYMFIIIDSSITLLDKVKIVLKDSRCEHELLLNIK